MTKALFWDFDGTLIYKDETFLKALHAALMHCRYDISAQEIRAHLHIICSWYTPQTAYADKTGPLWWDAFFGNLLPFYQRYEVKAADIKKINLLFKEQILDCNSYTVYADAESTLRACGERGYKNYILSNNFPELTAVIADLGLAEHFSGYIVSSCVGYEKPRAELFQYAMSVAHFPSACTMIGDNPVADIQGGKAAGMKTILVHAEGTGADHVCKSLSEVVAGLPF